MEQAETIPRHKPRVRVLDALRGFSVVSMVAYHTMYDLVYMFGLRAPWFSGLAGYIWQQSICWMFILVAGASLHYGRAPLRHAIVLAACAAVVTLVTWLLMPNALIQFGVLYLLAVCMLLATLLQQPLKKIAGYAKDESGAWKYKPEAEKWPAALALALCAALFVLLRGVPGGSIGLLDVPLLRLPAALYSVEWLAWLGFPGPGFHSADYFPIIPWVFLFFVGYFGWALLRGKVRPTPRGRNPLEWIGRHSLIIYMAHQPVIFGVLWLIYGLS